MKFQKNKKMSKIVLVMLLTACAIVATLPTASAHTPAWQVPTWTYIGATNNPIGVGQQLVIVFWTNAIPVTAQGEYGDRWAFNLDVTKPDGSREALGPFASDPVGGAYTIYTPNQVGTYIFVAKFIEKVITGQPLNPYLSTTSQTGYAYWGDTYKSSQSNPLSVTVQQQSITALAETPLPNSFWTRPVNAMNRNWHVLLGNWLSGAAQNVGPTTSFCYGTAPESAHVMWATPIWAGGIMDQRFGNIGYETGNYEGLQFNPPIIINGKIYYNVNSLPKEGWYCIDLYTGETEYFHNTTGPVTGVSASSSGSIPGESLAFGQIYNYDSPNQHGGMPYLWSTTDPVYSTTTWRMYDAYTGNYMCSIGNVTQTEIRGTARITTGATGTAVYGNDGSILRYNIVNFGNDTKPAMYLQIWNTSQAIWWKPSWNSNEYWMWRPGLNMTYDGRNGFSLNASIPAVQGSIITVREGKYLIGGVNGKVNDTYSQQGNMWALNLDSAKGALGSLLWNITYTPPKNVPDVSAGSGVALNGLSSPIVDPEDGVFIFNNKIQLTWYGYSLATGQPLWTSTPQPDFSVYGMWSNIYQGKLITAGYSGVLICYNITTGKILWNYTAQQEGFESPYGNFPLYITAIADGKIFTVSGEHSPTQPLWRGAYIRCIDANTGQEIWKALHWGSGIGGAHLTGTAVYMADGYIVGLNLYDAQIYCYGKGPSATTVNIKNDVVNQGNSVLITGTVTDESAGAKARVANGQFSMVTAVSDASQQKYMAYIYQQQVKPTDSTGVPVTISALDPNNNTYTIGTTTSDIAGHYGLMWTPPVPGYYTITATFAGSKSYYGSSAETSLGVSKAMGSAAPAITPTSAPTNTIVPTAPPTATIAPTPSPVVIPPTSATPTATYIAIGSVVIIVIVAAAALILRRRK
jgi:outer membrane protein assembly factor BamB